MQLFRFNCFHDPESRLFGGHHAVSQLGLLVEFVLLTLDLFGGKFGPVLVLDGLDLLHIFLHSFLAGIHLLQLLLHGVLFLRDDRANVGLGVVELLPVGRDDRHGSHAEGLHEHQHQAELAAPQD